MTPRPDPTLERRQLWRHLIQCVLAEQAAREAYYAASIPCIGAAEKRLAAEGVRLDAAIDALDETLLDQRRAS